MGMEKRFEAVHEWWQDGDELSSLLVHENGGCVGRGERDADATKALLHLGAPSCQSLDGHAGDEDGEAHNRVPAGKAEEHRGHCHPRGMEGTLDDSLEGSRHSGGPSMEPC